jgi:hypothetical protein
VQRAAHKRTGWEGGKEEEGERIGIAGTGQKEIERFEEQEEEARFTAPIHTLKPPKHPGPRITPAHTHTDHAAEADHPTSFPSPPYFNNAHTHKLGHNVLLAEAREPSSPKQTPDSK